MEYKKSPRFRTGNRLLEKIGIKPSRACKIISCYEKYFEASIRYNGTTIILLLRSLQVFFMGGKYG